MCLTKMNSDSCILYLSKAKRKMWAQKPILKDFQTQPTAMVFFKALKDCEILLYIKLKHFVRGFQGCMQILFKHAGGSNNEQKQE